MFYWTLVDSLAGDALCVSLCSFSPSFYIIHNAKLTILLNIIIGSKHMAATAVEYRIVSLSARLAKRDNGLIQHALYVCDLS